MSLNLPWHSRLTKKLIILRHESLESCRNFDNFNLEASQKNSSFFLPGYKVHLQLLPMRLCGSFVLFSNAKRESFEFLVRISQTVIRWNPCFWKDIHFLYFSLEWWSSGFTPGFGRPVSVIDHVTTSWDYKKVEHVITWILNSSFAKFQRIWSDFPFFKFLFSLTLIVCKNHVQSMLLGSLCSIWVFWKVDNNVSVLFSSEIFKPFLAKTHVFERSLVFCTFVRNYGEFSAPTRGCSASVGDHIMTSKVYIKVEHVGTRLLSSSFAKFQQFWSECFFLQVLFSLLTVYEGHIRTVCRKC